MFSCSHVRRAAPVAPLAFVVLLGTLVAAAAATTADPKAGGKGKPATPAIAVTAQATPSSVTDAAPACSKVRRKLWLEGEGWVIRRVPVCLGVTN